MSEEPNLILKALLEIVNKAITLIPNIIAAVVIFLIFLILAGFISRVARRGMVRRSSNPQPVVLVAQLVYWSTILLGLVLALQTVGFNLTAFLAGLGVAGFTIGFALQDVSKNFIAGLLMLIQQPFNVGDTIEVAGYTGTVLGIDLRATRLRGLDGRLVMIPNGEVYIQPITNFSQAEQRRIELTLGVDYRSDPERVREIALKAVESVPGLSTDPEPRAFFHNFGGSTFDLTVQYWIETSQTDPLQGKAAGLEAIKHAFEMAGIEMPYPAQVVILRQEGSEQS